MKKQKGNNIIPIILFLIIFLSLDLGILVLFLAIPVIVLLVVYKKYADKNKYATVEKVDYNRGNCRKKKRFGLFYEPEWDDEIDSGLY